MLNYERNEIALNGKIEQIKQFAVWWRTPVGLAATLQEAVNACKELDADPRQFIIPVPVAIGVSGIYEEIPPR